MKRIISASTITTSILLAMTSMDASAVVKCQPLVKKMKAQNLVVTDFSYNVIKEEKKLQRIINKIHDKKNQLGQIQNEISNERNLIDSKMGDKQSLLSSIQTLQDQKQSLLGSIDSMVSHMNQLTYEMENLPARSTALRNILREKKRTEKKIEIKRSQIQGLQNQMSPVLQSINDIELSIADSQTMIQTLKQDKQALKLQQPTLNNLNQRKVDAENILQSQSLIQEDNLALLEKLTEKVDVCKTYKVKYPLSLQIAKEIYEVGCDQYVVQNFQNIYKQQAENDTLNMICN